jgi:spore maturation protein CgeB
VRAGAAERVKSMSGKSVLISYFFGHDMIPLGLSCASAFRDLGYEVRCFNSQVESRWEQAILKPVNRLARGLGYKRSEIGKALPVSRINFKKRMLKQAAAEFRPKWVFIIRAHEFVDAPLVRELKTQCGVEKVFAWRVDGPLDSPDLLHDAGIYDCYFCSHRHGYDALADGIHHLPVYGMDFSLFRNLRAGAPRSYRHDLVLVGGHNARREHFVNQLLDLPLEIYGKWSKQARFDFALKKHLVAKGVWGEALLQLYNSSKIVLNITNWDPARHVALNQRVFDVPATGAFLLTDYSPELEEHYKIGKEIVCFTDVADLKDKARYFLANDAQREEIARRGYERALTLPTVTDRMRAVIQHVNAA